MKKILVAATLLCLSVFSMTSCRKPEETPPPGKWDWLDTVQAATMTEYKLLHPAFFPPAEIPDDNKLYNERIALGKMLFFDERISNDGSTCASCHLNEFGFSMQGVSEPDNGLTALPLINLAWYKRFMWNGRIEGTLEDVMNFELINRFATDIDKVNEIEEYRVSFKRFYDTKEISRKELAYALAQYMRVLVSRDSKYDRYIKGLQQLTFEEDEGRNIFFTERGDCFHCHTIATLTDNQLHNNGLDTFYNKEIDKGFFNESGNPKDLGMFRTPNLRNVALRKDFMHDGRFKTLEEVVSFYDTGVHLVANIDPVMTKDTTRKGGLNLTEIEKRQLVAFLKTLTDSTMINSPEFK